VALRRGGHPLCSVTPRNPRAMEDAAHPENERSDAWLIRDDAAGTLGSSLEGAIAEARALRELSEALGTEAEFVRWREALSGWRMRRGEMLRRVFEREAANEFVRGIRLWDFPPGKWVARLREDQRALDDTIELLVSLRHSLMARGGPRPRTPRRSPSRSGDSGAQP
jgi:hypothetical protein